MTIENLKKYPSAVFMSRDEGMGRAELESLFATFVAIKEYAKNNTKELQKYIRNRIVKILDYGTPTFSNGHNWGYPILCACLTLIKRDPNLWNAFSDFQHQQIEQCMRMFALMWNFGCNEFNDFRTGIGLHGDYRKKNVGLNYLLCNNALIMLIEQYYGSIDAINEIFATADYDTEIAQLNELKLSNAYRAWTTSGPVDEAGVQYPGARDLFHSETPKQAYRFSRLGDDKVLVSAGEGVGCKVPFAYRAMAKNKKLTTPREIFDNILTNHCFCRTCESIVKIPFEVDFSAHIADGTISPYEGQKGMISEFNKGEDERKRSSIFHCEIDFMMLMCYFEAMRLLGICEPTELPYWNLVNVGMEDFIYKKEHGYVGYAMYHIEDPRKWGLRSELAIQLWKEEYRIDNKEG